MKIYLWILFVKWLEINDLDFFSRRANDTHFGVMCLKNSKNSVSHPSFRASQLATFYFHLALGPRAPEAVISLARRRIHEYPEDSCKGWFCSRLFFCVFVSGNIARAMDTYYKMTIFSVYQNTRTLKKSLFAARCSRKSDVGVDVERFFINEGQITNYKQVARWRQRWRQPRRSW